MRIHHIWVDEKEVVVGATTQQRWDWELADGAATAVNATDLVWVVLSRPSSHATATTETVGLFPGGRGTPERTEALRAIGGLLEAAWQIIDRGWDNQMSRQQLVGTELP